MASLSSIEKQGVGMSRLNAERLTISQIDSSRPRSRSSFVYQYAQEVGQEIETMLAGMRRELVNLTPLHGQRAFVFLSRRLRVPAGLVMAQYASGTNIAASESDVHEHPRRAAARRRTGPRRELRQRHVSTRSTPTASRGEGVSAGRRRSAGQPPRASRSSRARTGRAASCSSPTRPAASRC
jgi:hypothetical protein